jgi:glycosyltransferase involved in cell wall biosynthesis
LLFLYALIVLTIFLLWLLFVIYVQRTGRHVRDTPAMAGTWPTVTIIVPAMNEEETIEPAMRSLMALDYPALQVIAVDDRSTDRTGAILDALAAAHPERLTTIHVTELPHGWLGKCNALAHAAPHATGEWILFTDADVIFETQAIRTAISFATGHNADHIVLFPSMLWHGYAEAALLSLFAMTLTIGFQTWRVEGPSKRAFIGIGAFNMVRRELYESFGGHTPLRLEVADDMKLGYLVKKHGGRSLAVGSGGQVRVRWRMGALDTVRGLERSGFAGVDFAWWKVIGAVAFIVLVMLAPYILPFIAGSVAVTEISLASIALLMLIYGVNARANGLPLWIGLLHPVAALLYAYALVRSAVITTLRGGLSWRGTFYSIAELKRGSVR